MADAFHGAPAVITVFPIARRVKIQPPPLHGLTGQGLLKGLFLDFDTIRHGQHALDGGVVDKQHLVPLF